MKPLISKFKNLPVIPFLLSILVFFAVVYFFLLPAIRQNKILLQQIKDKKFDLKGAQAPINEYVLLKEDISKKNLLLAEVKKRLFWEKDISRFLNELTHLASDLQIEFVSLKPEVVLAEETGAESAKKEGKGLKKPDSVPITVVLKSSYNDIISFLKRIEAGEKFIRIDSLGIESDPANIHKHLTKMKLSIFIEEGG